MELGLRLGQLGQRVAVGHDAATGEEAGPAPVRREDGAAQRDRPRAVAGGVDPPDGACVPSAVDALDAGDEVERGLPRVPADGRQARLTAGGGIVADSDPLAELAETQAKFQAMLSALIRP